MVQRKFGFPEAVLTGQRKATERESFRSVLDTMKSFTGLYVMMGEDIGTHILPPMPPRPLTQAKGNQEKAKEEDKKAGVEDAGSYDESEGVDESEGTEESEGMEEAGAYEGIEEARDMECVEQTGPGEDVGRVEEEDEEMDDEESDIFAIRYYHIVLELKISVIPFLSAQNMHTLAFTDVWADATNFQSLPVPTYINLNLSFSTPPSAPHSTTTRKADRSTHILTAISNHRTNSLTALTVSSPTMYDRPDFPLMSQASEEALRKLYQFKMQNALQVTAGIPGHSPSPKPPALAPPPRPQFAYYPPADGVRSPSRPHTTPAALSVHPYNRYDAHCLKRQQQEQQRLQQQRDGRCLYAPPSHMPTIVSQPPASCPYIPRIYPEPLTCITREMVFDRVYLLLLEHLTKRCTKNPNPLIYISNGITDSIIVSGRKGAFGPDGLATLTDIFVCIGHRGSQYYMCLATRGVGIVHEFLTGEWLNVFTFTSLEGGIRSGHELQPIVSILCDSEMKHTTPKTDGKTRSGLRTPPPAPEVAKEGTLRSRLQQVLDELPQNLPTYHHEELLDDLCFLLQSPLFLFAVCPRLRTGELPPESSPTGISTPQSLYEGDKFDNTYYGTETGPDSEKLGMEIKWDDNSWVTRLLHGGSALIEGRDCRTTEEAGFHQSFHWFCEEATFLCCEFRAREHAAAVSVGSAIDGELMAMNGLQTRAADQDKKKRRLVKLKVRLRTTSGRPLRATRRRK
ncbi:hypothetical protein TW65_00247 [Stemphylium lycopersici]|nr:hypothetical protein TW65_00247 [Stemphylium lycopersici]